ncbi:P1 family peptidase [Roseovarius sp. 2305UL8-3]|uniref:P1 family peptidase n=1 Tax=Roseovarius conchicola TaxID=3121636 RepID=UPI0035278AFA
MPTPSGKSRARDLGLPFPGQPGALNAITDVAGVEVGLCTLRDLSKGLCTGITAILPRGKASTPRPVRAGQFTLNGNGEMTGTHWIHDAGQFLGPICITNTHSVGMVHHAATRWMIDTYDDYFRDEHAWAMPVVAETYDGVLNDINAMAVTVEDAMSALRSATPGPVAEGGTGGGAGMICYEFKGGTGTSSRQVEIGGQGYTIGALVQANHGIRPWLNVLGKPVGQTMTDHRLLDHETGSIIVVLATDAPLSPLSLRHVARRAALGVGRGGSPGGNNSGDIFLAFSTVDDGPLQVDPPALLTRTELNNDGLDPLYLATVESVEEAVVNAMVAGEDTPTFKPAGHVCRALDGPALAALFAADS